MLEKPSFQVITKGGTHLDVYRGMEVQQDYLEIMNHTLREKYNFINERKSADPSYNCHGMTMIGKLGWFAILPTESEFFFTPITIQTDSSDEYLNYAKIESLTPEKQILTYLHDNGFRKIERTDNIDIDTINTNNADFGDIVLYLNSRGSIETIEHSGIIVIRNTNKMVLSKFSNGGEYYHHIGDVEDHIGKIVEIWSDRMNNN